MTKLYVQDKRPAPSLPCLLAGNLIEGASFFPPPQPPVKRTSTSITVVPRSRQSLAVRRVLPEEQNLYGWQNLKNRLHKNSFLTENLRIDAL